MSLFESATLALGAWYVLAYVGVALLRLRYPFELEWMEGAMVDHVRRVLAGQSLYVAPSIDFVPFVYPPAYYYLSAAASAIVGPGFLPLRLVSFLSSLGCFWLIFAIVRRESGSAKAGFLAVSLFAACFRVSGAWYDIARIDSLFLLLVLQAVYLLRFRSSDWAWTLAALLLAAALFTKQTTLLISMPLVVYGLWTSVRRGVLLTAVFAAAVGLGTWFLNQVHDGWYLYYVFTLPANIQRVDPVAADFWSVDIFGTLAIAFALSFAYLLYDVARLRSTGAPFYPLFAAGMLGSAWLTRLHAGAYDNDLIPAHAAISILFGLVIVELERVWRSEELRRFRIFVWAPAALQLAVLFYDPRLTLPAAQSATEGRGLVQFMEGVSGDVLMPQHGYLPALAGKRTHAHSMAVYDVFRAGREEDRARLRDQFHHALAEGAFGAVIVDRVDDWMRPGLDQMYRRSRRVFTDDTSFWPVTGLRTRPEYIYVAKAERPVEP